MTERFTVVVDFDDVLVPTMVEVVRRFNEIIPGTLAVEDFKTWDIGVTLETFGYGHLGSDFRSLFNLPDLYDNLHPRKDAQWAIQKMFDFGWNVIFSTAADHPGKNRFLNKWFRGYGEPLHLVVHERKYEIPADALVDDRLETIEKFGSGGVLLAQPWNDGPYEHNLAGAYRVVGWTDAIDLLCGIEHEWANFRSSNDDHSFELLEPVRSSVSPSDYNALWFGLDSELEYDRHREGIITNEAGGKQSDIGVRMDLLDGRAMRVLGRVLDEGAQKYEPDNWRLIPERDHINHALTHLFDYLAAQPGEDHLAHAFTRLMMAVAMREAE